MALRNPVPAPKRRLRLEYSGNMIKHLGLSMYGSPVPAIAELIANAWDADAHTVELTIPLGRSVAPSDEIIIKDFGRGMTWEEVADDYLVVGRNRRRRGGDKTKAGRTVMGHKGIGKLAGFGIARVVEVRTVRQRWLTEFAMDYEEMTSDSAAHRRYEPRILADRSTSERPSTTITLRDLKLSRAINEAQFRQSLARRFAVLHADFIVKVNGVPLKKSEMPLAYRRPEPPKKMLATDVPGLGSIKYWYGFTKETIKEEDARGIAVFVRGRMAQVPFIFNYSGGLWNQQDVQYLTGEVYADQLDSGDDDYVSTNRQTLNWEEGKAKLLQDWGQQFVKDILREYDEWKKQKAREGVLTPLGADGVRAIENRFAALPETVSRVASRLVTTYGELERAASAKNTKKSAFALQEAISDVMHLAETASRNRGDAVLRLATSRRNAIEDVDNVSSDDACAKLINRIPWLVLSPWKLVIVDTATTRSLRRALPHVSAIPPTSVMVVQHDTDRYIVVVGRPSKRLESTLDSFTQRYEADTGHKVRSRIFVVSDSDGARAPNVKTLGSLIKRARRSCDALLEALRA